MGKKLHPHTWQAEVKGFRSKFWLADMSAQQWKLNIGSNALMCGAAEAWVKNSNTATN